MGVLSGVWDIGTLEEAIPIVRGLDKVVISLKILVVRSCLFLTSSERVAKIQILSDSIFTIIGFLSWVSLYTLKESSRLLNHLEIT